MESVRCHAVVPLTMRMGRGIDWHVNQGGHGRANDRRIRSDWAQARKRVNCLDRRANAARCCAVMASPQVSKTPAS